MKHVKTLESNENKGSLSRLALVAPRTGRALSSGGDAVCAKRSGRGAEPTYGKIPVRGSKPVRVEDFHLSHFFRNKAQAIIQDTCLCNASLRDEKYCLLSRQEQKDLAAAESMGGQGKRQTIRGGASFTAPFPSVLLFAASPA